MVVVVSRVGGEAAVLNGVASGTWGRRLERRVRQLPEPGMGAGAGHGGRISSGCAILMRAWPLNSRVPA